MSLWKKETSPPPVEDTAAAGSAADVEEMMKKYDKESNVRVWEGVPQMIVKGVTVLFSLACLYLTLFDKSQAEIRYTFFLGFIVIIGYLNYPLHKSHVKPNSLPWYDIIIMACGSIPFFYYALNCQKIMLTSYTKIAKDPVMMIMAVCGILALVELCRRSVGIPILCVVGVLLAYTFTKVRFGKIIYDLFFTTNGVMGTPISVCQKYIVVFIIFGAFLERTGISNFFISLANCIAGSSAGGPAKVAVISSALCGMVSGSSVGNTVTTGSVTIPMMKKTGYRGDFAGAVEAAASTGGQIMPPIMGAAAFLMAEYTGVPYAKIALLAILPAALYFTGIYIAVHLEAKKLGLRGLRRDELPQFRVLVKKIYLLLPLVVLVILVSNGTRTMQSSAAIAILITIAVGVINNIVNSVTKNEDKSDNISFGKIIDALEAGGKGTITVAAACAMAGIVAGCITSTGLASKLLRAIVSVSGGMTIVALLLTMLCCIVLGMGVPTTANYCIMASTCAPILMSEAIGVPMLAAHFFVFYFGIVADITPPVALAAYAGAAIAKAPPMRTAFNATRLAIAAFVVPYVFALNPAMLLIGAQWYDVVLIALTALLGIFGIAAGLSGFVFQKLRIWERALCIAGGLTLLIPGTVTDLIGLVLVVGVCALNSTSAKKAQLL
ncbi:MAG: TRAP transporter fused permease subunit [Oscillospiraceae bacterium]|nr:TRAP transporter fused permease subunit [Oscillospiraceae bacterium]